MTYLPIGASHNMSRQIMAPSLWAALHSSEKRLGIIHHHITFDNSKANCQVEWTIRMVKACIQCGLKKEPASFWMNHLASALLLLCMTASWMMGVAPFLLATGHQPLLPSLAIPGLPSLPDQPTPDEEEAYLAEVSCIVVWL